VPDKNDRGSMELIVREVDDQRRLVEAGIAVAKRV